jgi:hypothetical protein
VNTNLLTVLQDITARYGGDILNDSRRVNALFAGLGHHAGLGGVCKGIGYLKA